ncbi:MAG: hypothetical protein Q9226_003888 [Calogaya cf. arnoldii]
MATSTDDVLERLPNEVLTIVLGNLPRKHLKQTRLVSKRLAALGALQLVDTVYISPREKDMVVFDAITKHPVFSKSIKKIVYDNARFADLSMPDYFDRLREEMLLYQRSALPKSNLAVRNLLEVMSLDTSGANFATLPIGILASASARCQHDKVFLEGYDLYAAHAQEHRKILGIAWFTRALEGFNKLGSIDSVVLCNTFNMPIFGSDKDYAFEDQMLT